MMHGKGVFQEQMKERIFPSKVLTEEKLIVIQSNTVQVPEAHPK